MSDPPFPTSGAIPERLQIGRTRAIGRLEAWIRAGKSVLLIDVRRVGKSSVALAALARLSGDDTSNVAGLHVDLRDGVYNSAELVDALRKRAHEQSLDARVRATLATQAGIKKTRGLLGRAPQIAGDLATEAGLGEGEAALLETAARLIAGTQDGELREVFDALDVYGRRAGVRVAIFIDEVQELAAWPDSVSVQQAITAVMRREGSAVSFVFAGSERHVVEDLFQRDSALQFVGERFALPAISDEDWSTGLRERFDRAGRKVHLDTISYLLSRTDGHPLKTMLVCAAAVDLAYGEEITEGLMSQALAEASSHPSWKDLG